MMKRRTWLTMASASFALRRGRPQSQENRSRPEPAPAVLPIEQYQPKSMLHAAETHVPRARFPLIDFHTHMTGGSADGARIRFSLDLADCLAVMDRKNIRTMVGHRKLRTGASAKPSPSSRRLTRDASSCSPNRHTRGPRTRIIRPGRATRSQRRTRQALAD